MAIGKSVKMCYLTLNLCSIVMAFFLLCLCNVPWNVFVMGDVVSAETDSEKGHALTLVESSNTENQGDHDDDGVVSVEASDEENGGENSQEKFEPTSDWKPVKNGQKISPGLHVRLNLQTGEKEAKLMDEPKKKGVNEWYAGEKMGVINSEKQRFTREQLKKALKDFKLEESDSAKPMSEDSKKKKFRSYDELKQAMNEMKMSVKTEAEIVTELMNKLKRPTTNVEDQKTILVDMEYYLHQIDNARLFCDLGGMKVISKLMNNSDVDIRAKATHALGSAMQSNAKVQINAIENGILQQLLRMISVDVSVPVKRKCLFALSTLLRQFPHAQRSFLEHGGLSAVAELFSKSQDDQLKIKIITLLTDLVQENDLNLPSSNEDEIQSERNRQYAEVKMREALEKSGWCTHLSSLLHQHSGHDNVEKVLSAMTILKETCQNQFTSLRSTLQVLSSQYGNLARIDKEQGETDTFFESIHHNIEQLLKDLKSKREEL